VGGTIVDGDAGASIALVRPDGILAARGSAPDTHTVIDYLRHICAPSAPESNDSRLLAAELIGETT
jgi:hypothetical protein